MEGQAEGQIEEEKSCFEVVQLQAKGYWQRRGQRHGAMEGSWAGGISAGHCSRRKGPTTPLCRPPLPGGEPQREQ